jgi:hypothetical protein
MLIDPKLTAERIDNAITLTVSPLRQVIQIHPDAPTKPAFGQPCNGCGVCCVVAPCPLGQVVSLRRHGACAALEWNEEHRIYRCGMVENPRARLHWLPAWMMPGISRLALRWIASAQGCDCDLEVAA